MSYCCPYLTTVESLIYLIQKGGFMQNPNPFSEEEEDFEGCINPPSPIRQGPHFYDDDGKGSQFLG